MQPQNGTSRFSKTEWREIQKQNSNIENRLILVEGLPFDIYLHNLNVQEWEERRKLVGNLNLDALGLGNINLDIVYYFSDSQGSVFFNLHNPEDVEMFKSLQMTHFIALMEALNTHFFLKS